MSDFEVTGKCVNIGPVETFGNFSKQMIALEMVNSKGYTTYANFEVTGKGLEYMDRNKVGDLLTVKFGLSGNKSNDGRFFNNLRAWYISGGTAKEFSNPMGEAAPELNNVKAKAPQPPPPMSYMDENDEEVPF